MSERALVAIDGIDGSGKSMLADRLIDALEADGVAAALFRVDDFRRALDWTRTDRREVDLYYDDYFDLLALDRCLRDFRAGAPFVEVTPVDLATGRAQAARRIALRGVSLAVVEGVFVRRLPSVTEAGAVIVVETTPAEARRRLLARDAAKGRSQAEIAHRIAARYFPAQDRYREALDPRASPAVVIDNERPAAARLLRLDEARVPAPVTAALLRLLGPAAAAPARW
ncbi:MAG TPA: hypothetical protein VMU50_13980 [Polyangia bacterium]|nr:hypothetical protein [Polyangia bacterium]